MAGGAWALDVELDGAVGDRRDSDEGESDQH